MTDEGTLRDKIERTKKELTGVNEDLESILDEANDDNEEAHLLGIETLRKFPPLKADHPLLKEKCAACGELFREGNIATLITLGPGEDPDERLKAREGRAYTAIAAPVHWVCATGEEI